MLQKYLANLQAVEGWLEPFSAKFIGEVGLLQQRLGVSGAAVEIGVHHGKLFLVLHNCCPGTSLAIDLFEDQHLNVDGSGRGSRSHFEANVRRWGDPTRIQVISGSSMDVSAEQIVEQVGRVAMFSVDGGHTAACTLNDLHLAEASLGPRGVVVIDDVFNASWPDVVTGFSHYMTDGHLRPFAITPNKIYLAHIEDIPMYRDELRLAFLGDFEKESDFFGATVDIYAVAANTSPLRSGLLKAAKQSPLYPILRRVKRTLSLR